jgi:hypothetical protein
LIRLDDARAIHSRSPPQAGNFVEVRGRRWLVEEVEAGQPSIASLSCIDDDAQGDELRVISDVELDARLLDDDPWSYLARDGADDAEVFAAFLRTIKWRTATAADRDLFQAPFRAGIRLDAYQLAPLNKALVGVPRRGVGELAERSAPSDRHESGVGARLGDEAVTVELR